MRGMTKVKEYDVFGPAPHFLKQSNKIYDITNKDDSIITSIKEGDILEINIETKYKDMVQIDKIKLK